MISSFENDETRIFYEGTEGDKDLWQEIRLHLECLKRNFHYITDFPKLAAYLEALTEAGASNKVLSWDQAPPGEDQYIDHSAFAARYTLNPAVLVAMTIEDVNRFLKPETVIPEEFLPLLAALIGKKPVEQWIHDQNALLWGCNSLLNSESRNSPFSTVLEIHGMTIRSGPGVWQRELRENQRLILIDLNFSEKTILSAVKTYLDKIFSNGEWQEKRSRVRKEAWQALQVWDLRESKMSFKTIGATLGITRAAALKRFYRAYELTQRRPFTAETRKTYEDEPVAQSPCEACDDRASCKKESCDKLNHFLPKVFLFDRKSVPLKDLSNGDDDDDPDFYLSENF